MTDNEVRKLIDDLRAIDFLLNYGPEEEKEAIAIIQAAHARELQAVSSARDRYKALHEDWIKDNERKEKQIENQVKMIETLEKELAALRAENQRYVSSALEITSQRERELIGKNGSLTSRIQELKQENERLQAEKETIEIVNHDLRVMTKAAKAVIEAARKVCSGPCDGQEHFELGGVLQDALKRYDEVAGA